jgi:hemerythrin-like metal-binding protein
MSFVDWSASYSVHDATLDQQHQKMFKIINNLHDAMFAKKGREIISTTIRELIEYSRTHFAEEERQMAARHFPGLAEHQAAHQELLRVVTDIERRYQQTHESMAGDVIGFLISDWLVKHILGMDKQYAPYLKK